MEIASTMNPTTVSAPHVASTRNHHRPAGRRVLRRVGAVMAGLLAIFVLSMATDAALHATGVFPPVGQSMVGGLFLLATAYRIIYGVAGGYITALLAPDRPVRHAVALGLLGVVLSAVGALATIGKGPQFGPLWYPLLLIVIALPTTWIGGKLRAVAPGA